MPDIQYPVKVCYNIIFVQMYNRPDILTQVLSCRIIRYTAIINFFTLDTSVKSLYIEVLLDLVKRKIKNLLLKLRSKSFVFSFMDPNDHGVQKLSLEPKKSIPVLPGLSSPISSTPSACCTMEKVK